MGQYYFLICSLPSLSLASKPEISFSELESMIQINVDEPDLRKIASLKDYTDYKNLRSFWLKKGIDERGNLSEKELESALLLQTFFPQYLFDFLKNYESTEYRLVHFSYLLFRLFQDKIALESGFLKEYFTFERKYRLLVTALRAKQLRRDISIELRYEDPKDFLVSFILSQKDNDSFTPPKEYERLKELFVDNVAEPYKLSLVLSSYRLQKIDAMKEKYSFNIDWLLGYMVELMIVEDWISLDKKEGEAQIDKLVYV